MKFNYKNSLLTDSQIATEVKNLDPYIKHLQEVVSKNDYSFPESSINLAVDSELLKNVSELQKSLSTKNLKYIIDVGIGGSNLGTKAVYDALYGFYDVLEPNRFPKMIFADTTNPQFFFKLQRFLEKEVQTSDEIIINAISKSGGTTETTANMEIIADMVVNRFGKEALKRLVITTDEESKLWNAAKSLGLPIMVLPKSVGGRYSVLSAVGLLPLSLGGINIESLRKGARKARELGASDSLENNPSLLSAIILYLHSKEGRTINDNFIFNQELESVGKWYRQLMGESIGKEHDLQKKVVHAGITPTVSIGSTDLHSVGQLYLGGPRDKMTTFISAEKTEGDVTIPQNPLMPGLVTGIYGKEASEIMSAILGGVKAAYSNQKLHFMEVTLNDISEESIGEFVQFKMVEMMYLGKLLNINTFDQPHVELYKTETKKILGL